MKERIWYLVVRNKSKWWLQWTEPDKWRDYWERRSKLHRKGSIFSHCHTHCQCCTQRFEAISSSIKWHLCCYVHLSVFSCVQSNKCQQNLSDIWNSWTPETYTSLPVRRDLRNRKIASASQGTYFDSIWYHLQNWIQISSLRGMPRKTFAWLWIGWQVTEKYLI